MSYNSVEDNTGLSSFV